MNSNKDEVTLALFDKAKALGIALMGSDEFFNWLDDCHNHLDEDSDYERVYQAYCEICLMVEGEDIER